MVSFRQMEEAVLTKAEVPSPRSGEGEEKCLNSLVEGNVGQGGGARVGKRLFGYF